VEIMVEKKKISHASGKRKVSIARATVTAGTGIVRVNNMDIDVYPYQLAREKILEPLKLAGEISKKVNVHVRVYGGGIMSQSEAVRNAIAKALVDYTNDDALKKRYLNYDRHLLIADTRRTEPQKPCRSSARGGKQTSKR
jgi:small subunit ribosomal protein S9